MNVWIFFVVSFHVQLCNEQYSDRKYVLAWFKTYLNQGNFNRYKMIVYILLRETLANSYHRSPETFF